MLSNILASLGHIDWRRLFWITYKLYNIININNNIPFFILSCVAALLAVQDHMQVGYPCIVKN